MFLSFLIAREHFFQKTKASWKNKNVNFLPNGMFLVFGIRFAWKIFHFFWNIAEKREEEEEEERVKYSQYSIGICIVYLYSNLIIYTIAFPVSIDPPFEISPP